MSNQAIIANCIECVTSLLPRFANHDHVFRTRISSDALFSALLGMLIFFALEVPDWLILLTEAPVPWLGHWLPYAVPLLLFFLLFNLCVIFRARSYHLVLLPGTLLFAAFIFTLMGLALAHWVRDGGRLSDWLMVAYCWVFLFYITLRSFDLVMMDGRAVVVRWSVRWILLVALIQFVFAML